MNAVLRGVSRTALSQGVAAYAISEGYQGMVDGGARIRELGWSDLGGIMQRGGAIIGTDRCAPFRTREGRLQAAKNLLERGRRSWGTCSRAAIPRRLIAVKPPGWRRAASSS